MNHANVALVLMSLAVVAEAQNRKQPELFEVPEIRSTWDDITEGVRTKDDWRKRRAVLKQRYLELLRDQHKPERPPLDLRVHEEVTIDGAYRRKLISYGVEAGERAHAYLGIPLDLDGPAPAIVALHGTYKHGKQRVAGLIDNPDKAYLDHLCRRGYVVIAPEHFVSGHRIPAEGPLRNGYNSTGSIRIGLPSGSLPMSIRLRSTCYRASPRLMASESAPSGIRLGGHGTLFLAAYDDRIKASACNCGGIVLSTQSTC